MIVLRASSTALYLVDRKGNRVIDTIYFLYLDWLWYTNTAEDTTVGTLLRWAHTNEFTEHEIMELFKDE